MTDIKKGMKYKTLKGKTAEIIDTTETKALVKVGRTSVWLKKDRLQRNFQERGMGSRFEGRERPRPTRRVRPSFQSDKPFKTRPGVGDVGYEDWYLLSSLGGETGVGPFDKESELAFWREQRNQLEGRGLSMEGHHVSKENTRWKERYNRKLRAMKNLYPYVYDVGEDDPILIGSHAKVTRMDEAKEQ